jgi:hypothetical protein
MDQNAKTAFIIAQTAMMNAEMQLMIAENEERKRNGQALAYGENQWAALINKWEPILGYNALISYLRD